MHFKEGTAVITADDHRVGDIARVVIDPHTREITHVVVRKGFLFSEDRVVPTTLIESASADEVRLRDTKDTLPELLPLVDQHFVAIDEDDAEPLTASGIAQPVYSYPPIGAAWSGVDYAAYWPGQTVAIETERNIPEGSILLNQGARVTSADGEHVGDIDEAIADPQTGKASHFVVAAGLLFRARKLIPTGWIQQVRSDEVLLSVRARVLEGLPDYES